MRKTIRLLRRFLEKENKSNLNTIALTQSLYLTRHLDKTLSAAYILGSIIKQNNGNIDNFEIYANEIYASIGNIDNLQLAPKGIIEKVFPQKGHDMQMGCRLPYPLSLKNVASLSFLILETEEHQRHLIADTY